LIYRRDSSNYFERNRIAVGRRAIRPEGNSRSCETACPTRPSAEIRAALHRKALRAFHRCNDTLVIDELGLAHAKARIEIAVRLCDGREIPPAAGPCPAKSGLWPLCSKLAHSGGDCGAPEQQTKEHSPRRLLDKFCELDP
jgi:hypothetical protein